MIDSLLAGREERELLLVTLGCGRTFTGRCTIIARQHFVLCPDPGNPLGTDCVEKGRVSSRLMRSTMQPG